MQTGGQTDIATDNMPSYNVTIGRLKLNTKNERQNNILGAQHFYLFTTFECLAHYVGYIVSNACPGDCSYILY